jgi:hypothetical protein
VLIEITFESVMFFLAHVHDRRVMMVNENHVFVQDRSAIEMINYTFNPVKIKRKHKNNHDNTNER